MSDFYQNGVITTLHNLRDRPLEDMEQELTGFAQQRPMALVLPCLYSELEGPALGNIVKEIAAVPYLDQVIIGLDRANAAQFEHARRFFSQLPQEHHILWQDGPRLRALDERLSGSKLAPREEGKGRNVWYCLGYSLALGQAQAIGLHDCDIVTYDRQLLARLFYPVAHPAFSYKFAKGYYPRVTEAKLNGRVTRLFVTPLIRALQRMVGPMRYLDYMDSFRYPLSGEFAFRSDVVGNIRIPSDWGLEIGILSELYKNYSGSQICQVDIADAYDHKHQPVSADDHKAGLAKMSLDIAKAFYRKLATNGVIMSTEFFRTLKATYFRIALDFVEKYYYDALINGLPFDRHAEESHIEVFLQSIVLAGEAYLRNPMEAPFIPSWNRVLAAEPDFFGQIAEAVEQDAKHA